MSPHPLPPMPSPLATAVRLVRDSRHVAVLTGAGISASSGIPTFRDRLTGLWSRFDAMQLATADAFSRDPALVWGWYEWRRMRVMQAQPNPAHRALAALASRVPRFTLVTQNVDDLHERAGSTEVIHLHGSLFAPRCFDCGQGFRFPDTAPVEPEGGRRVEPPRCARCDGPIRPGVVWFNEHLPPEAWDVAERAAAACDLLLVVGTSGVVFPAAGLASYARNRGAKVLVVNPDAAPGDGDVVIPDDAARALPAIVAGLEA